MNAIRTSVRTNHMLNDPSSLLSKVLFEKIPNHSTIV